MNKAIVMLTALLIVSTSAAWADMKGFKSDMEKKRKEHWQTQKEENKKLKEELRSGDMTIKEKHQARKEHQKNQHKENKAFRKEVNTEVKEKVKANAKAAKPLTEEEREELKKFKEEQKAGHEEFIDQRKKEHEDFVDSVLQNKDLTEEQKKEEIQKYRLGRQEKQKNFRTQRLTDRKQKMKELTDKEFPIKEPSLTEPVAE